ADYHESCAPAHTISDGRWYHLTFVYNGSLGGNIYDRLRIYVDGIDRVNESGGNGTVETISPNAFTIGAAQRIGGNSINAKMDEVIILRRAMSAPEVKALYDRQAGTYNTWTAS